MTQVLMRKRNSPGAENSILEQEADNPRDKAVRKQRAHSQGRTWQGVLENGANGSLYTLVFRQGDDAINWYALLEGSVDVRVLPTQQTGANGPSLAVGAATGKAPSNGNSPFSQKVSRFL